MKKTTAVALLVAVALILLATSCNSQPPAQREYEGLQPDQWAGYGFPAFVVEALRNTPTGAIAGVGFSDMGNITADRAIATTVARADISRQLVVVVMDMVAVHMAGMEADPDSVLVFQESITAMLSQSRLVGSAIAVEGRDGDGDYWVVVVLPAENAAAEMVAVTEAAAGVVPGSGESLR